MNMKSCGKLLSRSLFGAFIMMLFSNNMLKAQSASDLQDVQQIVAIVNDSVISVYDLKQRAMLISITSPNRVRTANDNAVIQSQAMQALIDDKLKLQEADKYDADVDNATLLSSFERYAAQYNLDADTLEEQLNSAGIQKDTLLYQIRGTMAWQGVVGGLLKPQVNVTDDEVSNEIDTLERNKGKDEYRVSEIFILITDNARRDDSVATADIIYQQLLDGADFSATAQQLSQSSTAAVGGDMGWVMENTLPTEVNNELITLDVESFTKPIVVDDGIYILKLTEKRQILTLNNNDIAVDVKHLYFKKSEADDQAKFKSLNDNILPYMENLDNCDILPEIAEKINPDEFGILGTFKIGEFPQEVGDELLTLEIGQSTKLHTEGEGYRAFILCNKVVPIIEVPNFDNMLESLTQARVELIARRHLRDLRRDAIVDYR